MIVNSQKQIELVNTCDALYNDDEVTDAIYSLAKLYGKPVQRLKRVFMYGNYPAISIYGDKVHLHRLLAGHRFGHGELRASGLYVHHKNHNKLDARLSNLELIDVTEHQSHHNKGKKFTAEHRAKISEGNRNRWRKKYPQFYENPKLLGDNE